MLTSLIMLLVLTLLGMASIQNAAMEERMAANDVFRNRAFQAADTLVDVALTDMVDTTGAITGQQLTSALGSVIPVTVTVDADLSYYGNGPAITNSASLAYLRTQPSVHSGGHSIGVDKGFVDLVFELTVAAEVAGTGGRAVVARGVTQTSPSAQ